MQDAPWLQIAQDATRPGADRDPFALLLGMLLDQQFPMERAFAGPAKVLDRFGCSTRPPRRRRPGGVRGAVRGAARGAPLPRLDGRADPAARRRRRRRVRRPRRTALGGGRHRAGSCCAGCRPCPGSAGRRRRSSRPCWPSSSGSGRTAGRRRRGTTPSGARTARSRTWSTSPRWRRCARSSSSRRSGPRLRRDRPDTGRPAVLRAADATGPDLESTVVVSQWTCGS